MHTRTSSRAIVAALLASLASAQTTSKCNPTTQGGCPADPALGSSTDIKFTSGASNDFTAFGNPTYGSNGVTFTVAKSGDSPQLTSNWYIMFGHYSVTMQAAPGAGICSSIVLQSDDLDEIDWEFLGAQNNQVQTNYFGKGNTAEYNREATVAAGGDEGGMHTYELDWTQNQITWTVDGTVVRTLTPADADAGQYPQTPMQLKLGIWAPGDSSEPQGTIQWGMGPTDYSAGPFNMIVQEVSVTDYSTGSSYSYSGNSGTWQSINSNGGSINGNAGGSSSGGSGGGNNAPGGGSSSSAVPISSPTATASQPPATSSVSVPLPFSGGKQSTASNTQTGWPWVSSTMATSASGASSSAGSTGSNGFPSSGQSTPASSTGASATMSASASSGSSSASGSSGSGGSGGSPSGSGSSPSGTGMGGGSGGSPSGSGSNPGGMPTSGPSGVSGGNGTMTSATPSPFASQSINAANRPAVFGAMGSPFSFSLLAGVFGAVAGGALLL